MPDETPHALGTLHDEVFAFLEATEPTNEELDEPADGDLDEVLELSELGDDHTPPRENDVLERQRLIRRAYGSSKE